MRVEDASWHGPTERVLARRRTQLASLQRERELLPRVVEALRSGRRAHALEAARALSKRARKIVEAGPASAVEERLEWTEARLHRCQKTLELASSDRLPRDLVAQVPTVVPPPGQPAYSSLEEAALSFHARSLDEDFDRFTLTMTWAAEREAHDYILEWILPDATPRARAITTDVTAPVPAPIFEKAVAAARAHLVDEGHAPFSHARPPSWRLRAPIEDGMFAPGRAVAWWVAFEAPGPRRGGAMPEGVWHGYAIDYELQYEPITGAVELQLGGFVT